MRKVITLLVFVLPFILLFGLSSIALGEDKPVERSKVVVSPNSQPASPDPNWDLKPPVGEERPVDPREFMTGTEEEEDYSVEDLASKVAPNRTDYQEKAFPAASYLAEGFDVSVPPAGWGSVVTNPGFTWGYTTTGPYSGTGCANIVYDPALVPQDEWLISPALDFTAATADLKVSFWWSMSYYWAVTPYNNYNVELWISTDGGATFPTMLWSEDSYGVFTNWVWYQTVIDLSAYVGQATVKLGWRYVGVDGAQAKLDQASVDDNPAPVGRCCYGDPGAPTCEDITQAACATLGGTWDGTKNCTANPCPVTGVGDNCTSPIVINIPAEMPYTNTNFTCGRLNDYSATCLGSYDGGEDIIYQVNVTAAGDFNITLNPKTTTYTGIAIHSSCPLDPTTCIAVSTKSTAVSHGFVGLHLEPGTYYIMIDTYPAPNCIPDFDLSIVAAPPPSPGQNCSSALEVKIPGDLPYTNANTNCGLVNDYSATCLGSYDGGEDIIYWLDVDVAVDLDLMLNPGTSTYTGILVDDACPPDPTTCLATHTASGAATHGIVGLHLEPGSYYVMIDTWPSPTCIPSFTLSITGAATPNPGDNCAAPLEVKLPEDMGGSSYVDVNTTCGHIDNYSSTCLGSYDGGEDIIYEFDVSSTITVDITLDPMGSTYTGIAIHNTCPLDPATCLGKSTTSGSGIHGIYGLTLDPGLYYVMIDTWPSPACITQYTLTVSPGAGPPENDDWDKCSEIGDVVNAPFTTQGATFDGPGTCQTAANVWFCYTATCTGIATASLCGSAYDTKMAVYDGIGDPATSTQLVCNDDFCGLQSQVEFPVISGNQYLIEVGGYSSNTGSGVISTSCAIPCDPPANDNCADVTPTTLTTGVTQVFTGNNCGATSDCGLLAPGTEAWEAFTIGEQSDVTLTYCGTSPSFELVYIVLADYCPCEGGSGALTYADLTDWNACGDGNVTMNFFGLPAGTYYIPVLNYYPGYESYYYEGPYTINVTADTYVPSYCYASGGCDEYISNVTVAEINNSSACDGYADYTSMTANMALGGSYPITVTNGNPYTSDACGVWVDWNHDLDFEDVGEQVTLDVATGNGPYTGNIVVPTDAVGGTTRLRTRIVYAETPLPCGVTTYGEVEDYSVFISGSASSFTVTPTSIDFGTVPIGATGSTPLTLGATGGESNINFSIAIAYGGKASVGGGECAVDMRKTPFQGSYSPAMEKAPSALLFEGFEGGVVPPTGWAAVVNNAFTWEIGSYSPYEGSFNADCFYDETYSGTQNEWLTSPVLNFAGTKYVLDFWWLGSYYWSVDPYDNCELEVYISTDGGATFPTMLWGEDMFGTFVNWEWNNTVIDLSAYKNETNVKLGFRYYGFDGAQFSIDAIAINPAPLSWLAVAPTSGTIPANGTVPVVAGYDAADLEFGVYNADLIITHTGVKGSATVPVTMTVGDVGPGDSTVLIEPYPIYAFMQFSYGEEMQALVYMGGEFAGGGHVVDDIDLGTVTLNGLTPVSATVIGGYPGFSGEVLKIVVSMSQFIASYPLLWDTTIQTYTVAGMLTAGPTPFSQDGAVMMIGHTSGDVNFDRKLNILDVSYLMAYLYKGGSAPKPVLVVGDANGDGRITILDVTRLIGYLYKGGDRPIHP